MLRYLSTFILSVLVSTSFAQNNFRIIENKGQIVDQFDQVRNDIQYSGVSGDLAYFISKSGISYQLLQLEEQEEVKRFDEQLPKAQNATIYRVDINWINANRNIEIIEGEQSGGEDIYYSGSTQADVIRTRGYSSLRFNNLYPGIDLKWYESDGNLEYDFIVAPGADPKEIKWQIKGARDLKINEDGDLEIITPLGTIVEQAPVAFQNDIQIKSKWKLKNNILSFELAQYNQDIELVIDPIVKVWGTYYGGTGYNNNEDMSNDLATDDSLNVFMSGAATSFQNIATSGAYQSSKSLSLAAFLVKFDKNGVRKWGTYCRASGSSSSSNAIGCAVDQSGNAYISGYCGGLPGQTGLATAGSHLDTIQLGLSSSGVNGFLVKFSPSGSRLWGTYYGQKGSDWGLKCATDKNNNVYMVGYTNYSSTKLATSGTHQGYNRGQLDGFVVKFDSSGSRKWGSYFGGDKSEYAYALTVDDSLNVFIGGITHSDSLIATSNSHQDSLLGTRDAFIASFNKNGAIRWSTYYGGLKGSGEVKSLLVDNQQNLLALGYTAHLPQTGFLNQIHTNGAYLSFPPLTTGCLFLAKFQNNGTRNWGTFIDIRNAYLTYGVPPEYLMVDTSNAAYVIGRSTSGNTQEIIKLSPTGVFQWKDVTGQTAKTCGVFDKNNQLYLTGTTYHSSGIATAGAHKTSVSGSQDIFLQKFSICDPVLITKNDTVCDSTMSYSGGQWWTSTGVYYDTITGVSTCDSILTVNLVVKNSTNSTVADTACEVYNSPSGKSWTNSGTYYDTLSNSGGCDSLVTYQIFIKKNSTASISAVACSSYLSPSGKTWNSTGSYSDTIPNSVSCDSIITVNLTINQPSTSTISLTNCGPYTSPSGKYTWTSTGLYKDTIANAKGCDSVMTIVLVVNQPSSATIYDTACVSYTSPSGKYTWTNSGIYTDTILNSANCDSSMSIHLHIKSTSNSVLVKAACNSYNSPSGRYTWTSSGTYNDTIMNAQGCDSLMYIVLTINNSTSSTLYDTVCGSYTSPSGKLWTSSGIYNDTIANSKNCDSLLTIHLSVGQNTNTNLTRTACGTFTSAGGKVWTSTGTYRDTLSGQFQCDSVLIYNLTINNSSTSSITDTSCEQYTSASGKVWTNSGTFTDTLQNSANCDSIITYILTIKKNTSVTLFDTVCYSYTSPSGKLWTRSGNYTDTIANNAGCDSIMNINLIVNTRTSSSINPVVCNSYTSPSGKLFTSSALFSDTIPNTAGCDSIIQINLTVNGASAATITQTTCGSFTSASGKVFTQTGVYSDTISNANQCDSVITYQLTINQASSHTISPSACDSYISPSGKTLTLSGLYTDTLTNANGCDSILSIQLTISKTSSRTISVSSCGSYVSPSGKTWTMSGAYRDTLTNALGCDSIITVQLTVKVPSNSTQTQRACKLFVSPTGKIWTLSGSYMDTISNAQGCDSIITYNLTIDTVNKTVQLVNGKLVAQAVGASYQWMACNGSNLDTISGASSFEFQPEINGDYAVQVTQGNCTDTSECIRYLESGVEASRLEHEVRIYPNPTFGELNLEFVGNSKVTAINLVSALGAFIETHKLEGQDTYRLQLNQPAGVYFLYISFDDGSQKVHRVVKK